MAAASCSASKSRRKSWNDLATGCTQSSRPFIGLTANTVSPKPRTKQKWIPSTPLRPNTRAPFGVQKYGSNGSSTRITPSTDNSTSVFRNWR